MFCPPVALATYAAVIVGTHLTGLMDTIMLRPWAGQLEHLVYVLVGFQFFTLAIGDAPIRWQLTTPARWVLLVLSMAVDTFTGVILIMSLRPVSMVMNGSLMVQPLSDTKTGGAIMWVGGDGLMALVMIALVVSWLRRPEQRERDRGGWMEQARQSTFATHTGATGRNAARDIPANEAPQRDRLADRIDFDDRTPPRAVQPLAGLDGRPRHATCARDRRRSEADALVGQPLVVGPALGGRRQGRRRTVGSDADATARTRSSARPRRTSAAPTRRRWSGDRPARSACRAVNGTPIESHSQRRYRSGAFRKSVASMIGGD